VSIALLVPVLRVPALTIGAAVSGGSEPARVPPDVGAAHENIEELRLRVAMSRPTTAITLSVDMQSFSPLPRLADTSSRRIKGTVRQNAPSKSSAVLAVLMLAVIATSVVLADTGCTNPMFVAIREARHVDKICHFGLFGVLAFLVNRALGYKTWSIGGVDIPAGPAVVLAVATLEELSQRYFPNRTLDFIDWVADFAGIALFTWLSRLAWLSRPTNGVVSE
jgi:polysaccharide biosynthesis protein VpsQ